MIHESVKVFFKRILTKKYTMVRKEDVANAVRKSFYVNDDGYWQVGNHVMTTESPPFDVITDRVLSLVYDNIRIYRASVRITIRFMLTWQLVDDGLFDVYFAYCNDKVVNTSVDGLSLNDTINNFVDQFSCVFLKHYSTESDA